MVFTARSSSAAARSATASEASADSARESVEIARAVQHREDAPAFELTVGEPDNFVLPVTITVISGPPSIYVTAVFHTTSATAPQVSELAVLYRGGDDQGEVSSGRALINGDEFLVKAHCVDDPVTVGVEVWLLSTDARDPTRQGHRKMRVKWPPTP